PGWSTRLGRVPPRLRARDGRPHVLRRRSGRGRTRSRQRRPCPSPPELSLIDAVVFDLDGVLLDTEEAWNEVRRQLVEERGGRWREEAQPAMMGMSSREWSRYMHEELGVPDPPEEISVAVVRRLEKRYRERFPLVPGAIDSI